MRPRVHSASFHPRLTPSVSPHPHPPRMPWSPFPARARSSPGGRGEPAHMFLSFPDNGAAAITCPFSCHGIDHCRAAARSRRGLRLLSRQRRGGHPALRPGAGSPSQVRRGRRPDPWAFPRPDAVVMPRGVPRSSLFLSYRRKMICRWGWDIIRRGRDAPCSDQSRPGRDVGILKARMSSFLRPFREGQSNRISREEGASR